VIRTAVLFVLTLAGTACAPDPATEAGAGPERIDCGVPNCSLRLPPGVMPVAADGTARRVLEHAATGVRMEVRVLETTPTESDAIPAELARLLDREEARLAPAVRFSQPPQGPLGIVVRGVSGTLQEGTDVGPGAEGGYGLEPESSGPVRVQLLSYTSPATGRVLLLRARAPEPQWSTAWSGLGAVTRDVRLEEGF
jgi:hypothetical protein